MSTFLVALAFAGIQSSSSFGPVLSGIGPAFEPITNDSAFDDDVFSIFEFIIELINEFMSVLPPTTVVDDVTVVVVVDTFDAELTDCVTGAATLLLVLGATTRFSLFFVPFLGDKASSLSVLLVGGVETALDESLEPAAFLLFFLLSLVVFGLSFDVVFFCFLSTTVIQP